MAFDTQKLKAQLLQQAVQVRNQASSFLVDSGYIQRRIGETVVDGQSVPVWAEREAIDCRFIAKTGASTTNVAAQYRTTKQTFYYGKAAVQLPYGTNVTTGDLFIYRDVNGVENVYEIVYVPAQHEFMGALVVPLEETT